MAFEVMEYETGHLQVAMQTSCNYALLWCGRLVVEMGYDILQIRFVRWWNISKQLNRFLFGFTSKANYRALDE